MNSEQSQAHIAIPAQERFPAEFQQQLRRRHPQPDRFDAIASTVSRNILNGQSRESLQSSPLLREYVAARRASAHSVIQQANVAPWRDIVGTSARPYRAYLRDIGVRVLIQALRGVDRGDAVRWIEGFGVMVVRLVVDARYDAVAVAITRTAASALRALAHDCRRCHAGDAIVVALGGIILRSLADGEPPNLRFAILTTFPSLAWISKNHSPTALRVADLRALCRIDSSNP